VAARVLAGTRSTCAWAALGHAVAAYETALTYAKRRTQFGKPLVRFQIIQDRLVRIVAEVTAMQLYCLQIGRLTERGQLSDTIAGLAKLNNTFKARQVCAEARDMLGGNGILLKNHVIRHMADIEAIHTSRAPRSCRRSSWAGTSPAWGRLHSALGGRRTG
jgi:glutaryl-CoA dehydrogenase